MSDTLIDDAPAASPLFLASSASIEAELDTNKGDAVGASSVTVSLMRRECLHAPEASA